MYFQGSDGSEWQKVSGGALAWISSGASGEVWGTNKEGGVFRREGVSRENPQGSRWTLLPGRLLKMVSIWQGQAWGVDKNNRIYHT